MARVRKAKDVLFRVIEDCASISGGIKNRPAPYLPIIEWDYENEVGIVIKAGQIVARDKDGYLVPANGGVAFDLTYTQLDVDEGIVGVDGKNPVTVGTVTGALAANVPIGIAAHDILAYKFHEDPTYKFQEGAVILKQGLAMYALPETGRELPFELVKVNNTVEEKEEVVETPVDEVSNEEKPESVDQKQVQYVPGSFLVPAALGKVALADMTGLVTGEATTVAYTKLQTLLEQKFGRVEMVVNANVNKELLNMMNVVYPASGFNLPGYETGGANNGIHPITKKALIVYYNFE